MSTITCLACHRSGDWDVLYMRLRAMTLLSRYLCGICDWHMQSSETVWCECRKSRGWREKCDWKFFNKTSLGGAARTAGHDIGAIYAIEHIFFLKRFSERSWSRYWQFGTRYRIIVEKNFQIAFLAPISWLAALATSPTVGRLQKISIAFLAPISWLAALATSPRVGRLQKISIAFLAPISWLAALATSPKLGRLQKNFNRISRANIVTSGTRNISKRCSTWKNFNRNSRANIVTGGTSSQHLQMLVDFKNFQSHFSRQYRYRDQRHSQHLQELVDIE